MHRTLIIYLSSFKFENILYIRAYALLGIIKNNEFISKSYKYKTKFEKPIEDSFVPSPFCKS